MSKLRLTQEERELCGFTPVAAEALSGDELGANSALQNEGFIPLEEIGVDHTRYGRSSVSQTDELGSERRLYGRLSVSQLRECLDPLEFIELRINPEYYGPQPLQWDMCPA